MFKKRLTGYFLGAIIGAGLSAGFYFLQKKGADDRRPLALASCFLQDNTSSAPFVEIDGVQIGRENIPPDLYTSYIEIEAERRAKTEEIARQLAVRMDAKGSAAQKVDTRFLPPLTEVLGAQNHEAEAKAYYEQNAAAFQGVPFENAVNSIKAMIQKRDIDTLLRNKMAEIEKQKRFRMLEPLPCGGKVNVPYANSLPGQGTTTGNLNLLYAFNYDCSACRQQAPELEEFLNQNMSLVRFWFLPIPGTSKTSRSHLFAVALQCAFEQSPASITVFHKELMSLPYHSPEQSNGENDAILVAKKLNLDSDKISKCMASQSTMETISEYQKFADTFQIDGAMPRYFLNGRGMDPNLGMEIINVMKSIITAHNRPQEDIE